MKQNLLIALAFAAIMAVYVAAVPKCDGKLVRGVFWYECVEGGK